MDPSQFGQPPVKNDWDQEFDLLKEMQENRMHLAGARQCLERCMKHSHYYTQMLLPHESACLEACLQKRVQAQFIVAANVAKFEELENRKASKGNKGGGWF